MANDRLAWLRELREARYAAGISSPPAVQQSKPRRAEIKRTPNNDTYRYRDIERRKQYMRDLMRSRRLAAKNKSP